MKVQVKYFLSAIALVVLLGGYSWGRATDAAPYHALWVGGIPIIILIILVYTKTKY